MKILDVPFVGNPENPSDKCVPAVLAMVLGYFMPERKFTMAEVEQLCGYQTGKDAWNEENQMPNYTNRKGCITQHKYSLLNEN
ncbi:hypothetical protein EOM60_05910 [Candidatus Saccharibacteria bacterium]|nr:hypothetical protein [Candidatus Saccharibacteria bacterium]